MALLCCCFFGEKLILKTIMAPQFCPSTFNSKMNFEVASSSVRSCCTKKKAKTFSWSLLSKAEVNVSAFVSAMRSKAPPSVLANSFTLYFSWESSKREMRAVSEMLYALAFDRPINDKDNNHNNNNRK